MALLCFTTKIRTGLHVHFAYGNIYFYYSLRNTKVSVYKLNEILYIAYAKNIFK
jgi:hypothetical protein